MVFQVLEVEEEVLTENIVILEMKSLGEQLDEVVMWVYDFAQVMMKWKMMEKGYRYQNLQLSF